MLLEQVELDFATEWVVTPQLAGDLTLFTVPGWGPLVFLAGGMVGLVRACKSQSGRAKKGAKFKAAKKAKSYCHRKTDDAATEQRMVRIWLSVLIFSVH